MSIGTLALGGGSYLGVALRQDIEISDPDIIGINTFNGLSVVFYSPFGEQIANLTAGRGNGVKLNCKMKFEKYGNLKSFNLEMMRNCDIPFFNGMTARFYYKNLPFAYGYIETKPFTDQKASVVSLRGVGFVEKLKDKKITLAYPSGTSVTETLKYIGSTYFLSLGIGYNESKIQAPNVSITSATWKDKNILTVIEDLIEMSNTTFSTVEYIFGIDEYGDFYFRGIGSDLIESTFFEGFKYQEPTVDEDASNVINRVNIFRTKDGDEKNTEYVDSFDDLDSQDKYGLYERKITIADYVDNTTIENIANGIIADWKDPKINITVKDLIIDNVLKFAHYNVTNKKQDQIMLVSDFGDDSEWTETFATAVSAIIDTKVLTGRLCYQLTINTSAADYLTKSVEYYMPTKIRVYIRQDIAGEYLSVSFTGDKVKVMTPLVFSDGNAMQTNDETQIFTSETTATAIDSQNLNVEFANEWIHIDIDLTGWLKISTITFTVLNNSSAVILLDRLEIFTESYVSRKLPLETVDYVFSDRSIKCDSATFGMKKMTLTEKLNEVDKKNNIPFDIFSKQ